ncbi:MAG TPA: GAP family protein [Nocardioides sp.]|uniref:GAP family protein n=1 Tax=Nocardioides sp. TaxID=35761 RepID=UPI002CFD967B|nr:GAP family protein [Nocardioides sp.]HQR27910.1 GAP family protein [Nocardioides sp.]
MAEAVVAALGIAVSPFAVIPAVLLLFTARPAACSSAFAAGWSLGVAVVTTLAILLADLLTLPDTPPQWASWTRIGLGGLLVLVGLGRLRRRSGDAEPPGWLRTLEEATPASAARFGLLASAPNPKVALLAVAGGFSIGGDLSGAAAEVAAVVGFTLLASVAAWTPLVTYAVMGSRALQPLGRVKDRLTAHSDLAVAGVTGPDRRRPAVEGPDQPVRAVLTGSEDRHR